MSNRRRPRETRLHVTSTGIQQHVGGDQLTAIDKRLPVAYEAAVESGTHLWVATMMHRVSDAALARGMSDVGLDAESLLMAPLVGCYVCEQSYAPGLRGTRCPGEPT